MSRNLDDLHPEVRWRAESLLKSAQDISIPILIFFTLRTFQEQEALYEIGRSKPGKIVTNAKPGQSFHNYGLAFDFVVDPPGPGVSWVITADINQDKVPDYFQIGELGEDIGLEWGGRWPRLKDYPHFQMSFGFSTTQLLHFYELGGLPRVFYEVNQIVEARAWP